MFEYHPLIPEMKDDTEYELLEKDGVSTIEVDGRVFLKVDPEAVKFLSEEALSQVNFFLREKHNRMVAEVLKDPEASDNDKYVARVMLENAVISAEGVLPFCQDTGTATCVAYKGEQVVTGCDDAALISEGVYEAYKKNAFRYSQTAPLTMYEETNTKNNLPAQIDIMATPGDEYRFLFIAKGGGSANKSALFQETKALLNPESLIAFCTEKMKNLGTAACPPYHIAFVIGGTSAETCMKVTKLASTGYYDNLPTKGNEHGQIFRDMELEKQLEKIAAETGIGAQFGGKAFAHDVRVIRMPRHGASCPVGLAVSCSADRNIKAKINQDGIWIEKMDKHPSRHLEGIESGVKEGTSVRIDLNRPMAEVLAELGKYPVKTRLLLNGTIVVARDMAHAKLKERIDRGEGLPDYMKNHPVYYAGPAKNPEGYASGSFGPTTAGRMDSYVELFQRHGGSLIMVAKGNRSQGVTDACKKYGGFYLGSIGGPAALLARENITGVELLEYEELGMEAVWKIEVKDFPAFIMVDNKGNDFFRQLYSV
ncbi:MAG: fumarate hydratase [Spirochaetales bacterium]|nr:fumarate hydratase [Spirochaetales bacterium]